MLGTLGPSGRHDGTGLHPAVEGRCTCVDDALRREGGRRDGSCRCGDERGGRGEVALGGRQGAAAFPDDADRAGGEPRTCNGDDLPVGEAG